MSKKLTEEQMKLALQAVINTAMWPIDTDKATRQLEAAAPYLQYPIDEPTKEELVVATMSDWNFASNHGSNIAECCRYALLQFVARRAALLPKPDPRREKVKDVLIGKVDTYITAVDAYKYADAILKALDEAGRE